MNPTATILTCLRRDDDENLQYGTCKVLGKSEGKIKQSTWLERVPVRLATAVWLTRERVLRPRSATRPGPQAGSLESAVDSRGQWPEQEGEQEEMSAQRFRDPHRTGL